MPAFGQAPVSSTENQGNAAQPSFAQLYASGERSDNATQRSGAGTEATIYTIGLNANLAHDGRKLDYGLAGDLSWVEYSRQIYDGATDGTLAGYLHWGERQDLLQWIVRDNITQSRSDAFANATPDNREYVNSFATGPTVAIRFTPRMLLRFVGMYTRQSYEDSPLDAQTLSGGAGLARLVGGGGSLVLFAMQSRTKYAVEALASNDFDTREYLVGYRTGRRDRTSLEADVGWTQVESRNFSASTPLLRLGLERRMGPNSALALKAEQQYNSSALGPGLGGALDGGSADGVSIPSGRYGTALSVPGAVRTRAVDLSHTTTGRRTTLTLIAGLRDEHFEEAAQFNRSIARAGVALGRRLRPSLTAGIDAEFRREHLDFGLAPDVDYQDYRFTLTRQFGQRLSVGATVVYSRRNDQGSTFEYTETRYGLRLNYLLSDRARSGGSE